ncbi:MAG TPA: hypothetical protein VN381_11105 [Anaerovoracaceae bacterium]|nr:hypothetical protein [Anaerovoracaceae bacterium]
MFFKKKKEPEIPAQTQTANYAPAPAAPAPTAPSAALVAADAEISAEIVAVITAAIAAFTSTEATGSNLIVRKISRIHGEKVSWSNAGLMECIDSRRF